ncbi:bifunctional metallophosphatase/5'-nucleotidase [Methylococcus geothermalis]|uniref:Bifunctional metallophosphatase/5'-nucleotidase n=1 Tax=Methylococcus geothermalis TaxID=2681310 RepID=A0A858Q5V0_9GAMM|nr:bifunctional metallophosphatase/5'-nucleotidase [Methylococcus geothermalis]QJD29163.1 bifunctional metallophosphatase/5'-nucleotidase [Methylococcus geothermalis]
MNSHIIVRTLAASALSGLSVIHAARPYAAPGPAVAPDHGQTIEVKIIAVNDFHGHLRPPGNLMLNDAAVAAGGVAHLAGYLRKLRAAHPDNVLVSAGDLIGASPLISANFQDEPTIEAMNLLGLDFNAVGNHEFDEGRDELLRMQSGGCHPVLQRAGRSCRERGLSPTIRSRVGRKFKGADFRFLAANVFDRKSGGTLFPPYGIKQFHGRDIGFIGLTLKTTPNLVKPSGVKDLEFRDEAETVNALVPVLRSKGIEAVVVLIHEGGHPGGGPDGCGGIAGPIVDIVRRLDPEVDLVVSGHTHETYACRLPNAAGEPVLVTSAHDYGRLVSDIDLVLDAKSGEVVSTAARNLVVSREITPEPLLARLVEDYGRLSRPIEERIIGRITASFTRAPNAAGESALGDLIADAQLEATRGRKDGGATVAFMNSGGIRADFSYALETKGRVRYREAFDTQPFGGTLVTMSLTGAQIEQLLEQQFPGCPNGQPGNRILQVSAGFEYTWRASGQACDKVDPASIRLGGKSLDPGKTYRIATNNFLADGGDGFSLFTQGTDRLAGIPELSALERYFRRHSPLTPGTPGRIRRLP